MTKRAPKGRRRSTDPRQADFLALLGEVDLMPVPAEPATEPGALDMNQPLRQLLNEALKQSGMDREEIALVVSARTGKPITKAMIDCWTGQGRQHRFPAEMIPAICAAVGNIIILQGLAEAAGCRVVERREAQLIRFAQLSVVEGRVQEEKQEILDEALRPFRAARHG